MMVVFLPLAVALVGQSANAAVANRLPASGNVAVAPSAPPIPASKAPHRTESCGTPSADSRVIIVCTQRPQGYRLNPDVMEARREVRSPGRPVRPGGRVVPDCATVGPFPCVSAGVNILSAAATAAEMAKRIASGQEVGSMFVTDPHPSEYQLYLQAKARRETEERAKAARNAAEKQRQARPAAGAVPQAAQRSPE